MSDSTNSFNWILSTQLVYSYWIASTFITGFWTAIYLFLFLRQRASPCGTLIHDATCLVLISSCIMLGFLPDPLWKRRYLDFNSPDRPSQTSLTRGRFMFGIVITDFFIYALITFLKFRCTTASNRQSKASSKTRSAEFPDVDSSARKSSRLSMSADNNAINYPVMGNLTRIFSEKAEQQPRNSLQEAYANMPQRASGIWKKIFEMPPGSAPASRGFLGRPSTLGNIRDGRRDSRRNSQRGTMSRVVVV
ncbi:hypothetical protein FPQ18DRAFT_378443 [Pyronema domesticum]|nr:hypothetical protein FPQ18DRAFT_378443 [Pyronema domesticum]